MSGENIGFEPLPELLDGIEPGSIGREPHQLDLLLESTFQHFAMVVNRPVVPDQNDFLLSISRAYLLEKQAKFFDSTARAAMPMNLTILSVERGDGTTFGIAGEVPYTTRLALATATGLVPESTSQWLTVEGMLITVEYDHLTGLSGLPDSIDPDHLGSIGFIRTGDVISGAAKRDLPLVQPSPDTTFTQNVPAAVLETGAILAQSLKCPAALLDAPETGTLVQLIQSRFGFLVLRGKKPAESQGVVVLGEFSRTH